MQKTKHDDSDGDETLVIKSKHSELNIINTERTVISKNSNESQKKTVIKEKYINITTRKRKSDSDKENDKQHTKIKRTKQLKLANSTNAILNHYTDNDKTVKAKIVANVIDKEGEDFGKDVLK